jgi:hypothetical protein
VSNAAKLAVPGTGDDGKTIVYDETGDAWVLAASTGTIQPLEYAISPEDADATAGAAKLTVRAPYDLTLTDVRLSASVASSSGVPTVDMNVSGTSVLSTKLTLDVGERTSETAAAAAVISDTYVADDTEIIFDIDTAGTGTRGLKAKLYHTLGGTPPAGDIEIASFTNTSYATRTNTTITKPTGTIDGDTLLLGIITGASGGNAPDPTAPTGTLLTGFPITATDGGFTIEMRIYVKVASSEGADWTFTHTNCASQGFALRCRNVNTTTPIDVNPSTNQGTGTTTTALGITPVTNNAMVIYIAHDWGDTTNALTPPTGTTPTFVEILDSPPPTGGLVYIAAGLLATAGATGNKTQTSNSGVSGAWGATLIALRPA